MLFVIIREDCAFPIFTIIHLTGVLYHTLSENVIPKIIYDENLNLFGEYENEKEKKKKYELKRNIDKLFISINSKNKWKLNNFITECPYVKGKYIIDTKYDKEIGLLLELDEGYSIDSREL